jgi:hypothetical protein
MRSLLLALALVLACKSGGKSAQPKGAGGEPSDGAGPNGTPGGGKGGGLEPPEDPCAPAGRPWDGKPKDCAYEHDGCCYDAAEAACAAAGCGGPACIVMESYPAQVRCESSAS